ncbi:hypothetical protein GIB67_040233, partial [Kingdonia uniflora]
RPRLISCILVIRIVNLFTTKLILLIIHLCLLLLPRVTNCLQKGEMGFILTDEANKPILAGHAPISADRAEQAEGKCIPWAVNLSAKKIRGKEVPLCRLPECDSLSKRPIFRSAVEYSNTASSLFKFM